LGGAAQFKHSVGVIEWMVSRGIFMSKVWLVTGSASGLGRHVAEAVLASGGAAQ
jgi:hypothetical protein